MRASARATATLTMKLPSERAPICLCTIVCMAVVVAPLTPTAARAAAPAMSEAEANEHFDRGMREKNEGNYAAAAAEFTAVYDSLPAASKSRASVLIDLVDARRSAFAAGGRQRGKEHPAAHLCAADKSLTEFIEEEEKQRGRKGKRSADATSAIDQRTEVRNLLAAAQQTARELDCATVEFPKDDVATAPPAVEPGEGPAKKPPRTPRKIDKPLVIAGGVLTGVGLAMVGLMAGGLVRGKRAEADGEALVAEKPTLPAEDPTLQEIDHRGKGGNRMAIAGGVLAGLALGTGVALLVVGLRGGRAKKVAVAPTMSPQALGLALRWQF